jgi:hypothetical protein
MSTREGGSGAGCADEAVMIILHILRRIGFGSNINIKKN